MEKDLLTDKGIAMRVLFVSASSGSIGGGELYLVYLGHALKAMGVEVGVWMSDDPDMDGLEEMFRPIGAVFRSPYTNTFKRRLRSLSHLYQDASSSEWISTWRAFRPDVLHINKQCLEDGLDLLKAAMLSGLPHGSTIHITQSAVELKSFLAPVRDWVARRALKAYRGRLWAIAGNRAQALKAFLGTGDHVFCIPNGVEIPESEEMKKQAQALQKNCPGLRSDNGLLAVGVGRLEEQKNPLRFLEIVDLWKKKNPGLSAVWVGDGRLREDFESRIKSMGASDWIRCVGWQPSARPYLALADAYIHPARFEGLPFALLEAMAYGLPCIISRSLAEDLTDIPMDTWIIADENEAHWLPHVLDREKLQKQGFQARKLAIERFSIQSMAASYVAEYERMVQRGAAS